MLVIHIMQLIWHLKIVGKKISHTEILDEVDKLLKDYNYDFNIDIVITGGEPLLYWNDLEFQNS